MEKSINQFRRSALKTLASLLFLIPMAALTFNCSSGGGGSDDPPPSSSSAVGTSSGGGSSSSAGGSSSSVAEAPKCGGEEYDTSAKGCCNANLFTLATQRCENNVIETKCGTGSNYHNPATQFCDGNSAVDKCGGKVYIPASEFCDTRDGGKIYKWTDIDGQIWMAENLNYNANGSKCGDGSSLSDENTESCDTYGRLYNWATAMDGAASTEANPSGVQGVCPSGWHLPSDEEWQTLINFVDGTPSAAPGDSPTAGKKLKADSDLWSTNTGTDDHGFAALPGGNGSSDGGFYSAGDYGYWWSSSEYDASYAHYRDMRYSNENVDRSYINKSYLLSIRCLQD